MRLRAEVMRSSLRRIDSDVDDDSTSTRSRSRQSAMCGRMSKWWGTVRARSGTRNPSGGFTISYDCSTRVPFGLGRQLEAPDRRVALRRRLAGDGAEGERAAAIGDEHFAVPRPAEEAGAVPALEAGAGAAAGGRPLDSTSLVAPLAVRVTSATTS